MPNESQIPTPRADTIRGLFLFAAAAVLFGLMAFLVKLSSSSVGGAQIAVIRFAIGLSPLLFIPSVRRRSFEWTRLDVLFYRGFFGGIAVLCYFSAIEHVPISIATLLNYTTPLFSGVYAAIFAGEAIRARVAVPMLVALSGITIVVRGNSTGELPLGFGFWELVALSSAVFAGAAVTAIRVGRRTENSWAIFSSFCVFGIFAALPVAVMNWKWPDLRTWFLLLGVGIVSIVAQLLMTHAFRWVETLTGGVVSQLAVIVSMSLGILVLGEHLSPMSAVGAALTLTGVISVMVVSSRGFAKEQ